jgi:para-aminobenzoate synthetase component II
MFHLGSPLKIVVIDHYDSFTSNLVPWLAGHGGIELEVVAFDNIPNDFSLMCPLVLSPGPHSPELALPTMNVVRKFLGVLPILGVCLGHQILGVVAGGRIGPAKRPLHGAARPIQLTEDPGILTGMPSTFQAGAYNSLVVNFHGLSLPAGWRISGICEHGDCQALSYSMPRCAPAFGVQFHPESFLSDGLQIRENFLAACRRWWAEGALNPSVGDFA